jgi:hypothetical protein
MIAQMLDCTPQPRRDRAERHVETRSDLHLSQPALVGQVERLELRGRRLCQRRTHGQRYDLPLCLLVDASRRYRLLHVVEQLFARTSAKRSRACGIDRPVPRDAEQPGRQVVSGLERASRPPDNMEDILENLFREPSIAGDSQCDGVE